MPQKQATARRRAGVSENLIRYLQTGIADYSAADGLDLFLVADPEHPGELRRLWAELGPDILVDHIRAHPGERPHAWWLFDCPRAVVGPVLDKEEDPSWSARLVPARLVFDADGKRVGLDLERAQAGRRGLPYAERSDRAVACESESAYLKRHNLLLPGEARRLTPADFESEALPVDEDEPGGRWQGVRGGDR